MMQNKTRGNQAEELLKNSTLIAAFEKLEAYYTDKMISTSPQQGEERDHWHICIYVLNDVKTSLEAFVRDRNIEVENERKREKVRNGK